MKIITEENLSILKKRSMSFIWRIGAVALVAGLNFIAANLNLFNLPVEVIVIMSLVLSEITKQLNK